MKIRWAITKTPKEWRIIHNLTQEEMARMLGISRIAYNSIEQGKTVPSIETMIKMHWLGESTKEIERNGKSKGYFELRLGGMYEIDIEEE